VKNKIGWKTKLQLLLQDNRPLTAVSQNHFWTYLVRQRNHPL